MVYTLIRHKLINDREQWIIIRIMLPSIIIQGSKMLLFLQGCKLAITTWDKFYFFICRRSFKNFLNFFDKEGFPTSPFSVQCYHIIIVCASKRICELAYLLYPPICIFFQCLAYIFFCWCFKEFM